MEKIKQFCIDHKKEIAITAAIIFAYRLGFKSGCKATEDAVNNLFKEATKAMEVIR